MDLRKRMAKGFSLTLTVGVFEGAAGLTGNGVWYYIFPTH
jgi:hypothetical protein